MGSSLSALWSTTEWGTILIVGLPNAGRVRMVHSMKLDELNQYTTCIERPNGFKARITKDSHHNSGLHKGTVTYVCWDLVDDKSIQKEWEKYFIDTKVMILVLNSTEKEQLLNGDSRDTVHHHLHRLSKHPQLQDIVVMVIAGKQSYGDAMSINHMAVTLEMEKITQKWLLYGCKAGFSDLNGALRWLRAMVLERDQHGNDETALDGYHERQGVS